MEVASVVAVLFFVIVVVGALFGGRSFGGVILSGIFGLILIGAVAGIGLYLYEQKNKEESSDERETVKKEEAFKQRMIESLSIEDKVSTDQTDIRFVNKCSKAVSLHIHYLTLSGDWKTKGSWEFDSGDEAYLVSGGKNIKTKNAILFYSVTSKDGSNLNFDGQYKFKYNWDTYNMKKVRDNYDSTEWSYSCP